MGRQNLNGNNNHQGRIAPYLLITIFMLFFDDILFDTIHTFDSIHLMQKIEP